MSALGLEIISPNGVLFQGECHLVTVPSVSGELGIMYGHESIVAKLQAGQVKIYNDKEEMIKHFDVESGFAEMNQFDRLTILIDDTK